MVSTMKIILGSSSTVRKQMMEEMGYHFEMMSPDIDEKAIRDSDPSQLVLKLGRAKADALLQRILEPALLVTSDHVLFFRNEILEKPDSMEQAREWMRAFQGNEVVGYTSVVVTNTVTGKRADGVTTAHIQFATIPEEVLEEYLRVADVMGAAGALRVQFDIIKPYYTITSGTFDTMMALNKEFTQQFIQEVQS